MLKKLLFALLAGAIALSVCAGDAAAGSAPPPAVQGKVDPAVEQAVRAALHKLSADARVDSIAPSALPGFYQVHASGELVYVSADGRYLVHGDLIDIDGHRNLTDDAWASFRKAQLAGLDAGQTITFAPPHPKYTVKVFTDVNCGYCRLFHEHIKQYNDEGIAVQYLAWPREGLRSTAGNPTPTYREMVAVWCAADRKAAFTAAKQGHAPADASCPNPVADQYALGVRLGVDGTPTVVAPDGAVLGGYVPPDKLLQMLQAHGGG